MGSRVSSGGKGGVGLVQAARVRVASAGRLRAGLFGMCPLGGFGSEAVTAEGCYPVVIGWFLREILGAEKEGHPRHRCDRWAEIPTLSHICD